MTFRVTQKICLCTSCYVEYLLAIGMTSVTSFPVNIVGPGVGVCFCLVWLYMVNQWRETLCLPFYMFFLFPKDICFYQKLTNTNSKRWYIQLSFVKSRSGRYWEWLRRFTPGTRASPWTPWNWLGPGVSESEVDVDIVGDEMLIEGEVNQQTTFEPEWAFVGHHFDHPACLASAYLLASLTLQPSRRFN